MYRLPSLCLALLTCLPIGHSAAAIGRIDAEPVVGPHGNLRYRVPIPVAAGVNGLQPGIALEYDSGRPGGDAGPGWQLTGFPVISRCGSRMDLDGRRRGLRFDTGDRFCLDGMRLRLVAGEHGRPGSEYRAVVHREQRIKVHGTAGSGPAAGPAWFELQHPDGLVYRFGHQQDARVVAPGRADGAILAWALDEIRDPFGNRIHFSYSQDPASGEHLPLDVRWTTSGGQGPAAARYRLRFTWEPRTEHDVRTGYRAGSHFTRAQRLRSIHYEYRKASGFEEVQRHELGYSPATLPGSTAAILTSIRHCAGGSCLEPVQFNWSTRVTGWSGETSAASTIRDSRLLFGNFTGQGTTDLLRVESGQWRLRAGLASGSGFSQPKATGIPDLGGPVVALDKTGNGLADLLVQEPGSGEWRYWRNTGGGFVAEHSYPLGSDARALVPLDMNGDGLDDLVYVTGSGGAQRLIIRSNDGGQFGPARESVLAIGPWGGQPDSSALPARAGQRPDFDGDGRQDLLFRISSGNGSVYMGFRSTGDDFETVARINTTAAATAALVADINGDGLTDLVFQQQGSLLWHVVLSDGSDRPQAFQVPSCDGQLLAGGSAALARAFDYSGDGRSDLLLPHATGWRIYHARGGCFRPEGLLSSVTGGSSPETLTTIVAADVGGNGLTDLMLLREDGAVRLRQGQGSGAQLPWRIVDSHGNVAVIGWTTLGDATTYGVSGGNAEVPGSRLLLGGSRRVVGSIWYGDPAGVSHGRHWRYLDARLQPGGVGFLGFGVVRELDDRDGSCSEYQYLQAPPFSGRLLRHAVHPSGSDCSSDAAPATRPLREYLAHWVELPDAAPGLVVLGQETERWFDIPGTGTDQPFRRRERNLEYDTAHAAILRETIEASAAGLGGGSWRTTVEYEYEDGLRSGFWCLGAPSRITFTRQAPDGMRASRSLRYTYDAQSRCTPASETRGPEDDPAAQLVTRWSRDGAGRILGIVRAPVAGEDDQREAVIHWDDAGLRPASIRLVIPGQPDPLTQLSWNHALGLPLREISPQGHLLEWEHDGFGRETRRSGPGAIAVVTTRVDCSAGCWTGGMTAHHRVREQHADGFWTERLLDRRGRVIGIVAALPGGQAGYQQFEYDALNRLRRASRPYLAGAPQSWSILEHDAHGRLIRQRDPGPDDSGGEQVTVWSWSGNRLTVVDPEQRQVSYWHDAEGRHWLVQAPLGGSALYQYAPFGELRTIIDPGYGQTTLEHDEAGRPVRITRPDSGTRLLSWNVFGELAALRDDQAPERMTRWYRDALGRVVRRSEPEGETRWHWQQQQGGGFGLLQQVTGPGFSGPDGYRRTVSYDALSRPREITMVIDGRSYQTSLEHDALGRRTGMTLPAAAFGARMSFGWEYADSGHLARAGQRFGSMLLPTWEAMARDAAGRVKQARLGHGGLVQEQQFDRASGRIKLVRTLRNGEVVQGQRYAWDGSGNLTQRQDLVDGSIDAYTHDALNRLVAVTRDGSAIMQFGYSPAGNLVYRSDAGHLAYLGQGPHAVSSLTGGPAGNRHYSYDHRGNMSWRAGGRIHWTSFDLPREINRLGDGCTGDCSRFSHGPARERTAQWLRRDGQVSEIHYVGPHFEVEYLPGGEQRFRLNLEAEGRTVHTQTLDSQLNWEAWFMLRDHLGSVTGLVRDFGSQAEDQIAASYAPFGQRQATGTRLGREGFTGHEHLDHLGLVHMRGRLMDPLIGRMLSADPFPGEPGWPQSLNPYSYAWNAPLRMVDPNGFQAVDLANFQPDPVSFDFRSVRDPLADAAETWTVAWGSLALGAGIGQFAAQLYRGWTAINLSSRQLGWNVTLEIAQGLIVASMPLGEERPAVPVLPETTEFEQVGARDPVAVSGITGGDATGATGRGIGANPELPGIPTAMLPLSLPSPIYAPPRLPDRIQYSFLDGPSNLVTRNVSADTACLDCHAGATPRVRAGQEYQGSRYGHLRARLGVGQGAGR